jgi:hypothetical protein
MQHHYHRKEALQTLLKNLKEARDQFWTSSCKRDGRGGALRSFVVILLVLLHSYVFTTTSMRSSRIFGQGVFGADIFEG